MLRTKYRLALTPSSWAAAALGGTVPAGGCLARISYKVSMQRMMLPRR
jgi:hypothetical protein